MEEAKGGGTGKPQKRLGWGSRSLPQARAAEWAAAHPR